MPIPLPFRTFPCSSARNLLAVGMNRISQHANTRAHLCLRSTGRRLLSAIAVVLLCLGCEGGADVAGERQPDLPQIEREGVLRAITTFSSTSYFIYRGRTMGFEYELLDRLADHLGLELEIVQAGNIDSLIPMLRSGEGDLVAFSLAVTKERARKIAFTEPLTTTHQVLVQRKPKQWRKMSEVDLEARLIRSLDSLAGRTIYVRRESSYYERLRELSAEINGEIEIEIAHGRVSTEELIRRVAEGEIEYTIADQNLAYITAADYSNLDVATVVGPSQEIAWALRKSSSKLMAAVNAWLVEIKKTPDYYTIYNKYFRNRKAFRRRSGSAFFAAESDRISPYDRLIQKHAHEIGWDWRLLAALVYQESQFDPEAESWAGAAGLMQLMPATAALFGVAGEEIYDPTKSLAAGTRYLAYLQEKFSDIPDTLERTKFVLAAYNAGENHVQDARRLAERYGEDPNIWTENVEEYMLLKSDPAYYEHEAVRYGYSRGSEPVQFVRDILSRYDHYRRLVAREAAIRES